MKSSADILNDVREFLQTKWARRKGYKVPEAEDLRLGNDAVEFEGATLYADLRKSTALVRGYKDFFAADIYKSFLKATCDVISNNNGSITSFDGDRVMAVFIGNTKCSDSAKTGLQIHSIVTKINAQIKEIFPSTDYQIDYAAGIDVSNLLAVRTGIRGSNDLAWIGNSANIAAKLSELSHSTYKTFITERLYARLSDSSKYGGKERECMWRNTGMSVEGETIYGSSWFWNF